MGKGAKWTEAEDNQLARSWVNASQDPVKGDDQTSDTFWSGVRAHWTAASLGGPDRSVQALKNRWVVINRATQKFGGYYAQVLARKASGKTQEDYVSDALELYLSLEKEVFQFETAWRVLRDCIKWRAIKAPKSTQDDQAANSGATVDLVQATDEPERPMGSKQAKRKAMEEAVIATKFDSLVRTHDDIARATGKE